MPTAMSSDRNASSIVIGSLVATVLTTDSRVRIECTEIAAERQPHPAQVLERNRVAEAVLLANRLDAGGVGVGPGQDAGRIAGDHADAGEDDHADDEEGHDRDRGPLDQEVEHRRRRLPDQFQDVPLIRIRPSGTALYPFRFLGKATM